MERFPYKASLALPMVSLVLLGGFSVTSFVLATCFDTPRAVPMALAVGGLLMAFPALRAVASLRHAPRAIVVDDDALKVPGRETATVDRIPWASIQAVQIQRDSISIRHPWGCSEIRERDVGAAAFARLRIYLDPRPASSAA